MAIRRSIALTIVSEHGSFYDGKLAPQGEADCKLARITSSSSLLSAGFWKKAAAPASKLRSSLP